MARAAWGFAGVALLITGFVMMQNSSLKADNAALTERLSDMEEEQAALQRLASKGKERSGDRRSMDHRRPDRDEPTPEDLLAEIPPEDLLSTPGVEHQLQAAVEERVQSEIGNRRAEWMERRRAEIGENIADFVDVADLGEDTREEMIAVMEDGMEDAANILRSRREDHSTPEQARQAMSDLKETVRSDLTEVLGEDDAEAFLETVHGPLKFSTEP